MLRDDVLDISTDNCSVARTLSIIGEKWTLLAAARRVRRRPAVRRLPGAGRIPRQVLTDRLARLVEHGLCAGVPYQEPGQRRRDEYRLTDAGRDLYPVLVALIDYGDQWLADPEGPSLEVHHRECGAAGARRGPLREGHDVTSVREVTPVPGPGARPLAG